ncbi:hypothetical protein [Ruminococcus sp.]|uniref:hypothetical protein n=1 Tax=Ruminococcus sp. TaxID=41978 RepID=UPI0025DA691C|nr:hypothetical protein [Ruminococcus sp.]
MSKRFPKPAITLDGIYSKFVDEGLYKVFLLDIRFENVTFMHRTRLTLRLWDNHGIPSY